MTSDDIKKAAESIFGFEALVTRESEGTFTVREERPRSVVLTEADIATPRRIVEALQTAVRGTQHPPLPTSQMLNETVVRWTRRLATPTREGVSGHDTKALVDELVDLFAGGLVA